MERKCQKGFIIYQIMFVYRNFRLHIHKHTVMGYIRHIIDYYQAQSPSCSNNVNSRLKCIIFTYLRIVYITSLRLPCHDTERQLYFTGGTSPYTRTLTLTEIGRSNLNTYTVITRQTINNSKSEHLIIVEIIAHSYR